MGAPEAGFATAQPEGAAYSPLLQGALRHLDALVDWERRRRSGPPGSQRLMRVDSRPARELLQRLGNPQARLSCVHVTGSKGKGTVAALLAAALLERPFTSVPGAACGGRGGEDGCGARVGTYGSPHVERVTERVRLDGREVADDLLAAALADALQAREQSLARPQLEGATWFDVMTAGALLAFQRAGAARAVVEVGMGGRLDSTNVLGAPVVVVTNVHLEHADIIGPSLRHIAYEKAGIITAHTSAVVLGLAPEDPLTPIFRAETEKFPQPPRLHFCPPLRGQSIFHTNLCLARSALRAVAQHEGISSSSNNNSSSRDGRKDVVVEQVLTEDFARDVLTRLPARQERFSLPDDAAGSRGGQGQVQVQVLLDGAHVPSSVATVLTEAPFENPVVVVGVGRDKDAEGIARAVAQHACCVFATVTGSGSPYLPATRLAEAFAGVGFRSTCAVVEDAEEAVHKAVSAAAKLNTGVVVIGSLHLAGRVRPLLRRRASNAAAAATAADVQNDLQMPMSKVTT